LHCVFIHDKKKIYNNEKGNNAIITIGHRRMMVPEKWMSHPRPPKAFLSNKINLIYQLFFL